MQDLLIFAKTLGKELRKYNSFMKRLAPMFILVRSVAEGTRVSIGNELDLTVDSLLVLRNRHFKCLVMIHFISREQKMSQTG